MGVDLSMCVTMLATVYLWLTINANHVLPYLYFIKRISIKLLLVSMVINSNRSCWFCPVNYVSYSLFSHLFPEYIHSHKK